MKKKIVLNACGVKSLGGVKLFVEAFEYFSDLNENIIVLYSEDEFYRDLQNQSYENKNVKFIQLTKKRYLHPFLNVLIEKKLKNEINSSNGIIHFGNFGFFPKLSKASLKKMKVQFCNPNWTSTFAQTSKEIYKRNQDEPKRAIRSFKESFQKP